MGRDGQRGAQRDRVSPCAGLGRDDEDDGSDGDDDEEERSRAGGNAEGEAEMERAREIRTSTVELRHPKKTCRPVEGVGGWVLVVTPSSTT